MTIASSTIRALIDSEVMSHASITAITDKIFDYDIFTITAKDINALKFDQRVNFFSYQVLRSIDYDITSLNGTAGLFGYKVECLFSYVIEVQAGTYNLAIDRMEILDNLIVSQLGNTWDSNFDIARQSNTQLPDSLTIGDIPCWKASVLWTGLIYA